MFWEPNLLTALQKLTALRGRRLEMAVQLEFLSLQIRLTLLVLMLQNLTAAWAVYLTVQVASYSSLQTAQCGFASERRNSEKGTKRPNEGGNCSAVEFGYMIMQCSSHPTPR